MEISDDLFCLYSAQVMEHEEGFVIEVPEEEIVGGGVESDAVYCVALLPSGTADQKDGQREHE